MNQQTLSDPTKKIKLSHFIEQINYDDTKETIKHNFENMPKYIAIRHIPIIFIIFIILLIGLLCFNYTNVILTNKQTMVLDKLINLVSGMIVMIAGIYLWTVRSEYHFLINKLIDMKNKIEKNEIHDEIDQAVANNNA